MTTPKILRCAIYTRKSTEDGLEQEFNSLGAQRNACEAYVLSQAGEGWQLLPTHYDDGGFSGGNMDCPGLKQLLADVDSGRIDIVVVYKVDRLTRSLLDFARIVERFDAASASFVSVTQAFNTTTSMGRLTLNVLLSFAQFEREVTGERIRDKIAASKARGMWMGGNPPLGYDIADRRLIINAGEAAIVRHIFARYCTLGSVPRLVDELDRAGIRSKCWTSRKGNTIGGVRLTPGAIGYMLNNRIYLGEIAHKEKIHRGDHEPIITPELFAAVQHQLDEKRITRRRTPVRAASCWLTGKIFDLSGQPMRPSFSYGRTGRIYRYYVSDAVMPGRSTHTNAPVTRVSAVHVERGVATAVTRIVGGGTHDLGALTDLITRVELGERSIHLIIAAAPILQPAETLQEIAARLSDGRCPDVERILVESDSALRLILNSHPRPRGRSINHTPSDLPCRSASPEKTNAAGYLPQIHRKLLALDASPLTPDRQCQAKAPVDSWSRNRLTLGFLAPDLQRAVLDGKLDLTTFEAESLPLAWEDQRAVIGRERVRPGQSLDGGKSIQLPAPQSGQAFSAL